MDIVYMSHTLFSNYCTQH